MTSATPLELPWSDAAAWDAERAAGDGRGLGPLGDERHPASPSALDGAGRRGRAADAAPPTPAWPRTPSTSTCRRGSAAATARPSAGPCTPCCRTPTSPTAHDIDAPRRRPVRRRGHLRPRGSRSPTCAARRSARRSSPPPPAGAEHWRELFVVAELGGTVLEGYIDLLVRTPDGPGHRRLQDRPVAAGRRPGRARRPATGTSWPPTALALGRLLDEPVAGGVLVRCRPDGPAEEIADRAAGPRRWPRSRAARLSVSSTESLPVDVGGSVAVRRSAARTSRGSAAVRDDRADALADAGEHPAQQRRGRRSTAEGDRRAGSSSERRMLALGVEQRAEHAGVDRRAVDDQRAHRVVDDRASTSLSAAPMTSSPPNSGSGSRTFDASTPVAGSTLAPTRYCSPSSRYFVSIAVADVDEPVVGVPLDGRRRGPGRSGTRRLGLRQSGVSCRQRADEHDVGQRRDVAADRHRDQPLRPDVRPAGRRRVAVGGGVASGTVVGVVGRPAVVDVARRAGRARRRAAATADADDAERQRADGPAPTQARRATARSGSRRRRLRPTGTPRAIRTSSASTAGERSAALERRGRACRGTPARPRPCRGARS